VLVHTSFTAGRGYYGSPRVLDDLLEWDERVSRKRVIRLMQEDGLRARVRKRYKGTTMSAHDQPIADNLLQQAFTAARPNQRWVGDTSELCIGENGKAYLAAVLDLYREQKPFPSMVLIDSPLVVYREPDPGEEQFPVSVKEAFYRTIAAAFKETQVIILENDEPPSDLGDNANIVLFTGKRTGRWGFLPVPVS
jgi:hypothetical protein